MGGSNWSDDFYKDRVEDRAVRNVPTFKHDDDVRAGRVSTAIHAKLDPKTIKVRESRDSEAHPNSTAIAVLFDVTGSMGHVPRVLQQKLPQLMGLLLKKGYVADPQVMMGAIGDYHSDRVPLQLGQYESGVEMDDDITNIYLEGNGGGQHPPQESYQNAFYFFSRKTSIDCFEKRGKKGFLFIIGDERPYPQSSKKEIQDIFGDTIEGSQLSTESMIRECQEKYNIFFVIPSNTSHGCDTELRTIWNGLVGAENVLALTEEATVCEVIGSTIGLVEGTVDTVQLVEDLKETGSTGHAAKNVVDSLKPLETALAKVRTGGVPKAGGSDATERL